MKIAVPASDAALDAMIERKLGEATYLMVIETDDMTFKAVESPSIAGGAGAGIQAVSIILEMGAKAILTGYMAPHIAQTLRASGIEVITGISGCVNEAVQKYRWDKYVQPDDDIEKFDSHNAWAMGVNTRDALKRVARQFFNILPVLTGVILLVGLLRGFMPRELPLSVFSGNAFRDTLWGACIGSLLSGNPINSYVIGETLLKMGVSLFGVSALMLTWVSVGLIQLPVEIATLGARFAILRTAAAFVIAMIVAVLTVILAGF